MSKHLKSTGPTLTNVTYIGRLMVKYGLVALVVLIVGRFFLTSLWNFWQALNPPPPPPPSVGFGLLPTVEFPSQLSGDKPGRYSLETKTGTLPGFGDRAKVFLMPESGSSLLNDQETRQVASVFGFVFEPEILTARTYRFVKTQPLNSYLEIDIQDKTFSLKSNYSSHPELFTAASMPDVGTVVKSLKSYLASAQLLTSDLATVSGEVVYLKSVGDKFETAVSLSEADFARVDLLRTPIDGQFQSYTPTGGQGTISAITSSYYEGPSSILEMSYNHHPVDYSHFETYPLRSSQSAWQVLQAGEAYIAGGRNLDQAVVRHIFLGYFDSFESQPFYQPIYVFSGDNGFLGYVSAVDPKYIQEQQL